MNHILKEIDLADEQELQQIMQAVSRRYRTLYPDWDVLYLSAPLRTPERRKQFHDAVVALLAQFTDPL